MKNTKGINILSNFAIAMMVIIAIIGFLPAFLMDFPFPSDEDLKLIHWILIFLGLMIIPSITLSFALFKRVGKDFIPVIIISLNYVVMTTVSGWLKVKIWNIDIQKRGAAAPIIPVLITIALIALANKLYYGKDDRITKKLKKK